MTKPDRKFRRLLEASSLGETAMWIQCPTHGRQARDPSTNTCLACKGRHVTNLEPCEKHEMIGCQVCSPPVKLTHVISHAFEARYPGWCRGCQSGISQGELIVMYDDGARHEECIDDV